MRMKKAVSILIVLLFALTLLVPVGGGLSRCFGYRFELFSISGFAVVLAVISILTAILDLSWVKTIENKAVCVIVLLLPPLTLVNGLLLGVNCRTPWGIGGILIYMACCLYLMVKHGKPMYLKVTSIVLTIIAFAPTCLLGMLVGTVGMIVGEETLITTIESPSGEHYAQVELGNENTHVMLYEKSGFNALLFKVRKQPRWLYSGEYLEHETMDIYFQDDSCLVINSVPYEIQ